MLLIDKAKEMSPNVLSELRILSSADFDATSLLTVILAGDGRLVELLRHEDLIPLGSRIRTRLVTEPATRDELLELLQHTLLKAGNAALMTAELISTLVDHSSGNYRLLMNMGNDSWPTACRRTSQSSTRNVTWSSTSRRPHVPRSRRKRRCEMHVDADQSFPVVRVGDISSEPGTQRWLVDELWGELGGRDRRCPQVRRHGWGWTWLSLWPPHGVLG